MKLRVCLAVCSVALVLSGCNKKKVAVTTPPAPAPAAAAKSEPAPPARPSINIFTVAPGSIQPGASATLRWSVANASQVSISGGIGSVKPSGSEKISPVQTTTYNLTATGPGGSASGSTTLNIRAAPASMPTRPASTLSELVDRQVQDVYFAYDNAAISEQAGSSLAKNASALKEIFQSFPDGKVIVEGHCDERGSAEYNLALGDRRAQTTRDYLSKLGVPAAKLDVISYGKERPVCTASGEACWSRNRRAHFTAAR